MKTKLTMLYLAVILSLLLSAFAPAPARSAEQAALYATTKLKVKNLTSETVYLQLTGTQTYNFTVYPGNATLEVERGDYSYSYYACNKTNTGTLKKADTQLKIPACAGASGSTGGVKLTIMNQTGEVFWIQLNGVYQQTPIGKSEASFPKGTVVNYDYFACGTAASASIKMNGDKRITLKCPKPAVINIKFNIDNATTYITLSGPQYYYLTIGAGERSIKQQLLSGTYNYSINVCNESFTGKITVPQGQTVQLNPAPGRWTCITFSYP
jgi:hypothetical protein